ncbi:MAG: hypothetical protein IPK02_11635 [Candidatus Accumulibacter sp.]|uniref:Uncharacterized protein n=1 Tax=Candidatus Accumulibacter affinis TaxID=2954384 RepID=A0A935T9I0_9PROT|nr:hypothetical protein [Candidatus Accumulibacter affinis]
MRSRKPNFSGVRLAAPGSGLFGKLLSIAAGTLLLVAALLFSLFAVSVLVVGGLLLFAYLQWKTRHLRGPLDEHLRAQMRRPPDQADEQAAGGCVIEGEVIGEAADEARPAGSSRAADDLPARCDPQPRSERP